ncbi:hypothetical protein P3U10_04320 [Mammaliicoccus sciuri]|uniref:hypothetical protein n=1 Tax=Mammaliicoccus sciuri TaxID=1296 RepID=UPI002B257ACD|nr:hypothetical protein [Mammaliicoccus sciuri]WQK61408.1 hypothetical protein P3U10_04320 [Mammaliicoccus sciuri]
MKKLIVLLFTSLLVLGACGQNFENAKDDKDIDFKPDEDNKKENKNNSDKKDNKSEQKKKEKTEPSTEETSTNEQQSPQEVNSIEQANQEQQSQVNTSNISNESQLQSILYGNFSEEQKIQAYNSAVANGVIPQGTVSEGSAQDAYESSKGIQNGETEKDQLAERYQSWVDAGLMTEEEMQEELAK